MKKLLALIASTMILLTGCTSQPEIKTDPRDENIMVFEETLDNGIQLQIYRISEGTLTEEYQKGMSEAEIGDPIIAVKYVLTNKSKEPVDIKNVALWNGNFKNSQQGIGIFNYGELSLHTDLGYTTLPEEFVNSQEETWMLQPEQSATFAYDWLIQSEDLIMTYNIVFPNNQEFYTIEVDLKKPEKETQKP